MEEVAGAQRQAAGSQRSHVILGHPYRKQECAGARAPPASHPPHMCMIHDAYMQNPTVPAHTCTHRSVIHIHAHTSALHVHTVHTQTHASTLHAYVCVIHTRVHIIYMDTHQLYTVMHTYKSHTHLHMYIHTEHTHLRERASSVLPGSPSPGPQANEGQGQAGHPGAREDHPGGGDRTFAYPCPLGRAAGDLTLTLGRCL